MTDIIFTEYSGYTYGMGKQSQFYIIDKQFRLYLNTYSSRYFPQYWQIKFEFISLDDVRYLLLQSYIYEDFYFIIHDDYI